MRNIIVNFGGTPSTLGLIKISREKLYGSKKRVPLDVNDARCAKAELALDGALLLLKGMTGQGYFDGNGMPRKKAELVHLDDAGQPVDVIESTLGREVELERVDPEVLLDARVSAVYALELSGADPALLDEIVFSIFRFPFSWSGGPPQVGFLVGDNSGGGGAFVLVGQPTHPTWSHPGDSFVLIEDDDDDIDDDIDFDFDF